MLGLRDRPRWRTIKGGSRRYVEAITAPLARPAAARRARRGRPPPRRPRDRDRPRRGRGALRRGRDRRPRRPGAGHARRPVRPRARDPRRLPVPGQRGGAAHRPQRCCPRRRRAWASWNYHLLDEPSRAADRDLPHEPPAVAAGRPRVLRHAQPHRRHRPRARHPPHPVRAPGLHGRRRAGAGPPRARSAGSAAPTSAAPTGAGASTRTASGAARGSPSGSAETACDAQRALRGHGAPPPLRGAPPRPPSTTSRWRTSTSTSSPSLLGGRLVARRPGLVRFRREDYLGDPAVPLKTAVAPASATRAPDGPIRLLTNLRTLGLCFNPVSFYYCFDRDEQPAGRRRRGHQHAVGRAPRLRARRRRAGPARRSTTRRCASRPSWAWTSATRSPSASRARRCRCTSRASRTASARSTRRSSCAAGRSGRRSSALRVLPLIYGHAVVLRAKGVRARMIARRLCFALLSRIREGSLTVVEGAAPARVRRRRPARDARGALAGVLDARSCAAAAGSPSPTPTGCGTRPDLTAVIRVAARNADVDRRAAPPPDAAARALPARPLRARAQHARAQPARHRRPLRPRQRAVRADARPDDDVLERPLPAARHDARGGVGRQARPGLREARPRARRPRARDRHRLGRLRRPRRAHPRLPRDDHDALARSSATTRALACARRASRTA